MNSKILRIKCPDYKEKHCFFSGCTRKTRIVDVVYNASSNELVRTKTLVKNSIIQIDGTPFRQWYEAHYALPLGRRKTGKSVSFHLIIVLNTQPVKSPISNANKKVAILPAVWFKVNKFWRMMEIKSIHELHVSFFWAIRQQFDNFQQALQLKTEKERMESVVRYETDKLL